MLLHQVHAKVHAALTTLQVILILSTCVTSSSTPSHGHPRRPLKSKPHSSFRASFPSTLDTHKTSPKRNLVSSFTPSANSACSYFTVQPVPTTPDSTFQYNYLNVDTSFYRSIVNGVVPVAGSNLVSKEALLAAARMTSYMLAGRPDIVQTLTDNKVFITIMAMTEVTTDVPLHSSLGSSWDQYRGIGATEYRPTTSAGEENVLCNPTCYTGMTAASDQCDIYFGENILIHEFGHSMTCAGGSKIEDASWSPPIYAREDGTGGNINDLFSASYVAATSQNKWKNTYAGSNSVEYAAEGIQSFFGVNAQSTPADGIHNDIDTRSELQSYDQTLYDILIELFPTTRQEQTGTPMHWKPGCGCSDTDRVDFPIPQFENLPSTSLEPPCLRVNNQCVDTCPETYYPSFPSDGSDGTCNACLTRIGCGNCASSQVCTSCIDPNKVLHEGTCRLSKCPDGLVPAGNNNECIEGCDVTTTLSDITSINGTVGTCVVPTARFFAGTGTTVLSHDTSCAPTCPSGHTMNGDTICSKGTKQDNGCTNDNEGCNNWASSGECDKNPNYMEMFCKKACKICSTSFVGGGILTPSRCSADPCELGSNAIPTNGKLGTCSGSELPSGSECQPECQPGFVASGTTKCFKGTLTAAICSSTPPSPCKDARNMPYGTSGNCPVSLNSGLTCTPQCNQEYSLAAASITGSTSSPRLSHSCDNGILTRATCDECTSMCSTGTFEDVMCTTLTDRHCSTCDTSKCADLEPPLFLQGCGGTSPGTCQECATGKMFQSSDRTCVPASCTLPASFEGHYRVETNPSTDSCIYNNILEDNQSCNVMCKNGFKPKTVTSKGVSFHCTGGVLSSPSIACVPKNCYLPSPFNENVIGDDCGSSGSQLLDGASCKVKCKSSEYMANSGTLTFTCSAGAIMSTPSLTCDPKPCTSGANGQDCRHGGIVTGFIPTNDCGCACVAGYSGNHCETATVCTAGANGQPCENNGNSSGTNIGGCSCTCQKGYTGSHCQTVLHCVNGPNDITCKNGATATGTIAANNCACTCSTLYQGTHCETEVPCATGASGAACENGQPIGTLAGNDCSCNCNTGFEGETCATAMLCTEGGNGQACQHNGTPFGTQVQNNCGCTCVAGYQGDHCEEVTPCLVGANNEGCNNGGTPKGETGQCSCQCVLGYSGSNCNTLDACTTAANGQGCVNGGSAVGKIADGNCACQCLTLGFEGVNCEIETPCTGGTRSGTPCQNGGTARGTTAANDCGCDCLLGWTGAFCQTKLQCTVGENGKGCENGSPVGDVHAQTCKCQCDMNYEGANCKTLRPPGPPQNPTNVPSPSPSTYTPSPDYSPSPTDIPGTTPTNGGGGGGDTPTGGSDSSDSSTTNKNNPANTNEDPNSSGSSDDVNDSASTDSSDTTDSTTNYFMYGGGIVIFVLLVAIVVVVSGRRKSSSSQRNNVQNNLDPFEDGKRLEIGTMHIKNPTAAVAIAVQTPFVGESVWVQHFDPATGKNFYFNRFTGETSWEKKSPTHERAKSSLMPKGWAKHVTEDGNKYYANQETGKTTWEKPAL